MKFSIVSDSSCDIPPELIQRWGIHIVPFYVSFDGETYRREGRDISAEEFYQTLVDRPGCYPKTSMPTLYDYGAAFCGPVKKGLPVLCICLNAAFSGACQTAANAAALMQEEFPGSKIHVMDSQLVTVLQGLLVHQAVQLRDQDLTLEEAVPRLEALRETGRIFFTTNDLDYLSHGGRIGKAAAATGTVLQLKPMIEYRDCGLHSAGLVRGRKKSLQRCMELFREYVERERIDLSAYTVTTGYGYDHEEYAAFNEQAEALLRDLGHTWERMGDFHISVTIGVHTGPHPIGIGLLRRA